MADRGIFGCGLLVQNGLLRACVLGFAVSGVIFLTGTVREVLAPKDAWWLVISCTLGCILFDTILRRAETSLASKPSDTG